MSIFEQYTMAIPIFFPNVGFLTNMHVKYLIVGGLNGNGIVNEQTLRVQVHPKYNGTARVRESSQSGNAVYTFLDPRNNYKNPRAAHHWISLADYYYFPDVVHFESAEQLVNILHDHSKHLSKLIAISSAMRETNRSRLKSIIRYWRRRLIDIAKYSPNSPE